MANVIVPGVAQVVARGTISGHPWANVFHFKLDLAGQNWSITQLNSTCEAIMAGSKSHLAPLWTPNVVMTEVVGVDLGTTAPATGISATAAFPGTATDGEVPPSTCMVVTFQSNARYRGGHPRAYYPPGGFGKLTATEDQWLGTFVQSYSLAVSNVFDAAFAATPGMFQCAVRYNYSYAYDATHHKVIKTRESHKEDIQIFNWVAKAPIGTQRRRVRIGG